MSDPVTNAEIEDVLSSIRRLVSEEPLRKREKQTAQTGLDKLILTPAFRVTEADGAESEDSDQAKAPEEPAWEAEDDTYDLSELSGKAEAPNQVDAPQQADDAAETAPPVEDPSDQAQAAADPQDVPDAQPSQSALESEEHPEEHPGDPPAQAAENEAESGQKAGGDPDAPARMAPTDTLPPSLSLHQRIAELEAAIGQSTDEWEPDGSEDGTSDETRPLGVATGDRRDTTETDQAPPAATADRLEDPAIQPAEASDDADANEPALDTVQMLYGDDQAEVSKDQRPRTDVRAEHDGTEPAPDTTSPDDADQGETRSRADPSDDTVSETAAGDADAADAQEEPESLDEAEAWESVEDQPRRSAGICDRRCIGCHR